MTAIRRIIVILCARSSLNNSVILQAARKCKLALNNIKVGQQGAKYDSLLQVWLVALVYTCTSYVGAQLQTGK